MTYPGQPGYTGLYLGTLKSGWDFWWLLLKGAHNLKGKPWISCLLLTSPNSAVMERGAVPAAACRAKRLDWWVAARIVTYQRVGWAIDSFAPYKSPGMDRILPALLQEEQEVLIPYLVKIFHAYLATGYIPAIDSVYT